MLSRKDVISPIVTKSIVSRGSDSNAILDLKAHHEKYKLVLDELNGGIEGLLKNDPQKFMDMESKRITALCTKTNIPVAEVDYVTHTINKFAHDITPSLPKLPSEVVKSVLDGIPAISNLCSKKIDQNGILLTNETERVNWLNFLNDCVSNTGSSPLTDENFEQFVDLFTADMASTQYFTELLFLIRAYNYYGLVAQMTVTHKVAVAAGVTSFLRFQYYYWSQGNFIAFLEKAQSRIISKLRFLEIRSIVVTRDSEAMETIRKINGLKFYFAFYYPKIVCIGANVLMFGASLMLQNSRRMPDQGRAPVRPVDIPIPQIDTDLPTSALEIFIDGFRNIGRIGGRAFGAIVGHSIQGAADEMVQASPAAADAVAATKETVSALNQSVKDGAEKLPRLMDVAADSLSKSKK